MKKHIRLRLIMGKWYIYFIEDDILDMTKCEGPMTWAEANRRAEELYSEGWAKEQ